MTDITALLQRALETGQLDGLKFAHTRQGWQVSAPSLHNRGAWAVAIDRDPFAALAQVIKSPETDNLDFMQ